MTDGVLNFHFTCLAGCFERCMLHYTGDPTVMNQQLKEQWNPNNFLSLTLTIQIYLYISINSSASHRMAKYLWRWWVVMGCCQCLTTWKSVKNQLHKKLSSEWVRVWLHYIVLLKLSILIYATLACLVSLILSFFFVFPLSVLSFSPIIGF